jgi:hypothetical protein
VQEQSVGWYYDLAMQSDTHNEQWGLILETVTPTEYAYKDYATWIEFWRHTASWVWDWHLKFTREELMESKFTYCMEGLKDAKQAEAKPAKVKI